MDSMPMIPLMGVRMSWDMRLKKLRFGLVGGGGLVIGGLEPGVLLLLPLVELGGVLQQDQTVDHGALPGR